MRAVSVGRHVMPMYPVWPPSQMVRLRILNIRQTIELGSCV